MKTIPIACKIVAESDKAFLIQDGATDKEGYPIGHWIPKSQVDLADLDESKIVGTTVDLEINEWLAKERGLI